MTYLIIYEDKKESRNLYKEIILKLVGGRNEQYKIIEIEKYDKEAIKNILLLEGKKIFIIDIEVPGKSGLDLARDIRRVYEDWESQIIVVTNHQQFKSTDFIGRLLMLDFISKYYNCEEHLRDALIDAINILDRDKCLPITCGGELYNIPYSSILYIEKKKDEDPIIVTKRSRRFLPVPLNTVWKLLESDNRFFKSTGSCIINLYNISGVDFNNQIIKFGKIAINNLSRDKKKELKERMGNR